MITLERLKTCTRCLDELPHDAFHSNASKPDGLQNHCKECRVASSRKERIRRADAINIYVRQYRIDHAIKVKARAAVYRAVKSGKLIRPDTCNRCKEFGNIQGHHHDYTKPLDIEWICTKCHGKE